MKLKPLSEQVMVITGASSGIGLATARAAAEHGARVVLAARTRDALAHAVDVITQAGGEAVFVEADVARLADVERIAGAAIDRFGGFDTWVNNAGVSIWGLIDEVSEADMRQLFEINFWGVVHGSRVAVRLLKGRGGALINIGSVASEVAFPVQGIYSASKHAVKGFTEALRIELEAEGAPISVTLVKPTSIGTPLPQHARNYRPEEAKLPSPIYAPEEVARAILHAAEYPVRDLFVGGAAKATSRFAQAAPALLDRLSAKFLIPAQFGEEEATPGDNLYVGRSEAKVRGDHQGSMIRPSLYTRAATHPAASYAAVGAAAAGVGLFLWARQASDQKSRKKADARRAAAALDETEAHPT